MQRLPILGFSLVEILVGLALGSILLGSLINVYLSVKNTSHQQQDISELQENGRTASNILATNIRTAGYAGCSKQNLTDSLRGYTSNNPPQYLKKSELPKNSDIIVIKKANTDIAHLIKDINQNTDIIRADHNPATESNSWLLITDCGHADLVKAQNIISNNIILNKEITHHYQHLDTEIGLYTEITYFIGKTSYQGKHGQNIYALYQVINGREGGRKEELVSSINNMHITYGFDKNDTGKVDNYYSTSKVPDWGKIISVMIDLDVGNNDYCTLQNNAHCQTSKSWPLYITLRERI